MIGGWDRDRPDVFDRFFARSVLSHGFTTPISSMAYTAFDVAATLSSPWSTSRASTWPGGQGNGPLPVGHACYFVHQAALGLQHAHEAELVHRDIKPGNLMLSSSGTSRLSRYSISAWPRARA